MESIPRYTKVYQDETSFNELKLNSKQIFIIIIFISLSMILVSTFLIVSEFYIVKKSCEDLGFKYDYNFPTEHLCNNKPFFKYTNGWDFSKEINYSGIISPTVSP